MLAYKPGSLKEIAVGDEMDRVIAAARLCAAERGLPLHVKATYFVLPNSNGYCHNGSAGFESIPPYKPVGIWLEYDLARSQPQDMWWCFCHELGHVDQWRDNLNPGQQAVDYDLSAYFEPDAWRRAEVLAKRSPWPPTAEFYKLRDASLATYGLTAVAA